MPDSFRSPVPAAREPVTPVDLLESRELSPEMMAYLWLAVENKMSIVFCGSRNLNKSRYLDALSFFIPREASVASISVGHEWAVPHGNWQDVRLSSAEEMPAHIWGSQAKKSDYLVIERLERIGLAMAPFPMAGGKSVCSAVDFDDFDDFVKSVTGATPLMHKVQLTPFNVIATVKGMQDSDSMGDCKRTPQPLNQKVAFITEMVGYNQNNDKIIVNEPYWWEKKGEQSAPHHFDWFFFSGHSFLYDMMMDQKKWSAPEMEAEILRRTDFLRWLFHQKKSEPAEILSELVAYAQNPIAVSHRCSENMKGVVLPIDGAMQNGTPLPRTKARLREI